MRRISLLTALTAPAALAALAAPLAAQVPPGLAAERAGFTAWLTSAPNSPYAAIYHQPLAGELVFGPGADPALLALPRAVLTERGGALRLRTAEGERAAPRHRDVPFGNWRFRVSGERGRRTVTVFGPVRGARPPAYHPYDRDRVVEGTLELAARAEERRMLGLDGIEVTATLAGAFVGRLDGAAIRLTVYRMSEPGGEEAELMIFFRDGTNGVTTYPAGRFLAVEPLPGGRYRADFNRARNPFCAYNGVFPCPLPWPGNAIAARIEAGERYAGTGARAGAPAPGARP